jgi:hypothetical protein
MDIDLDLYRHEVRVSTNPLVHGAVSATSLVHTAAARRASLVRLSALGISSLTSSGFLTWSTSKRSQL